MNHGGRRSFGGLSGLLFAEGEEKEKRDEDKEGEKKFLELGVPLEVSISLGKMGIMNPSQIQRLTIKRALSKENLIIQSKNGTGKSLSMCIILVSQLVLKMKKMFRQKCLEQGQAKGQDVNSISPREDDVLSLSMFLYSLIIVPTRELCIQLHDIIVTISDNIPFGASYQCCSEKKNYQRVFCLNESGEKRGMDIAQSRIDQDDPLNTADFPLQVTPFILYGGTDVFDNIRNMFISLPNIVICTPGRLKHVVSILRKIKIGMGEVDEYKDEMGKKSRSNFYISYLRCVNVLIKRVVIDEIDALLEEQFADQINTILSSVISPRVQVLCYSSTFLEFVLTSFIKRVNCADVSYVSRVRSCPIPWRPRHQSGLEPQSDGIKELQNNGIKEPQSDGIKELQKNGIKEPQSDGVKEPQSDGIKELQNNGVKEPQSDGIKELQKNGIKEPQSDGIKEPHNSICISPPQVLQRIIGDSTPPVEERHREEKRFGEGVGGHVGQSHGENTNSLVVHNHDVMQKCRKSIKKKRKRKNNNSRKGKKSNGVQSIEATLQIEGIFSSDYAIKYILQKLSKEREKISSYARKKREFQYVRTCTSVIVHSEERNEGKAAILNMVNVAEAVEDVNNVNFWVTNRLEPLVESPVLRNIRHCFITVDDESMIKKEALRYKMKVVLKIVRDITFNQCFLFINNTYEGVQITKMLNKFGISCFYTSSKIEHAERVEHFKKFKNNKVKIVVCTDVMSRGIDNIICDLVINFDIPQSKETYIHRSGRCGRYGKKGLCISLCNYSDYSYLYYFKYQLKLEVLDFHYVCHSIRGKGAMGRDATDGDECCPGDYAAQQVEQHVEHHAEQHVEHHAEKHVEHHAEQHVEHHAEKHVEHHAEQHVEHHAEKHVEHHAEQHVEHHAEKHVEHHAEQHVEHHAEKHVEHHAEQHVEHHAEKHVEHHAEQHVEHHAEKHVEHHAEQHVEHHAEKHVEHHAEQHVEHHAEKHVEHHAEQHVEYHAEKHVEHHVEKNAEQDASVHTAIHSPVQGDGLRRKKGAALKINMKGFYAKGVHIADRRNGSTHSNVYLKVYFKELTTKVKVVKNENTAFFILPNDNINFFESINIIKHKSNRIIHFSLKNKIRVYYSHFNRLHNINERKKKWFYSNFCFLFFCDSNDYLVLKLFYAFLFFFKHYKYPLREDLAPIFLHTQGGNGKKKQTVESQRGRNILMDRPKLVRRNYTSDSYLLTHDMIRREKEKKKKKGYETDENICLNGQGVFVARGVTQQTVELFPFFSTNAFSTKGKECSMSSKPFDNGMRCTDIPCDSMDYNMLEQKRNVTFNTLSLEEALDKSSSKLNAYEKKMCVNFSYQCAEIQCKNDEEEIIQRVNSLMSPQIFLNLSIRENVNIWKSVFLQNHVQLHEGVGK
ncbi:ATP-dependent RNA helicase DHH1, putative [Plasmodium ovale]|uniref:ATP-dependent RNA helicase DHH1, putative n=1 Tax=Plasmodium ovale TaxID=36330 RepID=A0A1D3KZ43_PLAOA|nr:ATP-dependent RNA helicase DHH1, putative [Plasmodium ovale]